MNLDHIPEQFRHLVINDDPVKQREVQLLQNDLIHLFVAYHLDRLRHGHAVGLSNALSGPDAEKKPNAHVLKKDIQAHGRLPQASLREAVEQGETNPISFIRRGVLASAWDSLNHVLRVDSDTVDPRYSDFISDAGLQEIIDESDEKGKDLWSFSGSNRIHSGFQVGLSTISSLTEMQYALRDENESFDAARLSHMLAKSDDIGLTGIGMNSLMLQLQPQNTLNEWSLPDSKIGIPYEKLREYLRVNEPGCSARLPIRKKSYALLEQHGLNTGEYSSPPTSAIKVVARFYRNHAFSEWASLADLSDAQKQGIADYDRYILFPELRNV